MLTARGRPEDVLRGFESGADDYLPKPFELGILLARVSGLLRRRRWNERDAPVAADAAERHLFVRRTNARLQRDGDPGAREDASADPDGMRAAPLSRLAPGPGDLPRHAARGRVGAAREHRHACHRQLRRAAAGSTSRIGRARRSSSSPCAASATSSSPMQGRPEGRPHDWT